MKALPSQERALRKRTALISAAVEEFSSEGFEVATSKSIAAVAGVATGTFYQYFENKNDMLCVIATERFAYLHTQIEHLELQVTRGESGTDHLVNLFTNILRFVYEFHAAQPKLHQVLEQRRNLDAELSRIIAEGEAVLKARVRRFVRDLSLASHSSDEVADNLMAMSEGLVHSLVFHETNRDPELAINVGAEMLASYFKMHGAARANQH